MPVNFCLYQLWQPKMSLDVAKDLWGGCQSVPKPHLQTHNSMVRSWLARHSRKLKPALKLVAGPRLLGGVVRLLWLPTLPQWLVDAECIGTKRSLHAFYLYHIYIYSVWEKTRHIPKTPLKMVLVTWSLGEAIVKDIRPICIMSCWIYKRFIVWYACFIFFIDGIYLKEKLFTLKTNEVNQRFCYFLASQVD